MITFCNLNPGKYTLTDFDRVLQFAISAYARFFSELVGLLRRRMHNLIGY